MEGVAAFLHLRSLQVLEGVDGFDLFQEFSEPLNAALWLAVLGLVDEFGNLALPQRAVEDGIAFDDRDFDLVNAREQERFPLFLVSAFDGEPEAGMLRANQLSEFLE